MLDYLVSKTNFKNKGYKGLKGKNNYLHRDCIG